MADDNEEFLQKTKDIQRILLRIGKVEERIAKLNTKIKEAESEAEKPGPRGDSQGSVGSPSPHNNQAEVIVVLKEQLEKEQEKLAKLNTQLNKYAGRRRTRRGGRPPAPASPPTYENLKEMDETLAANPAYAGMFLDYLIAVKSHFPNFFAGNNAELSDAVKLRATGRPFDERVKEIVRSLKASVAPRPALAPRRQLPIIHVGRLRAAIGRREGGRHRTRKSRKTRRS